MPMDESGKYRMNPSFGKKAEGGKQQSVTKTEPQPGPDGKVGTSGDKGTNPPKSAQATIDQGMPDLGAPPEHAASHAALSAVHQAAGGGKHVMISKHDDGSITSHHIGDTGEVEGPHDHANLEELKQHLQQILEELEQFFTEEETEYSGAGLGGY